MKARHLVTWGVAAIGSAAAAMLVARHATPIDDALPFIALVVTVVAAASHPVVQLAVPLLLLGEIVIVDERLRLFWFGVVLAAAFAAAMLSARARSAAIAIAVAAVLLLRWIPFSEVLPGREIAIVALAAGTVFVLGATPLAIAVAVIAALFTPAVPLRTLLIPLAVLLIATTSRLFGTSRLRLPATASFAVAVVMAFFAWSGAFARAFPFMLRGGPPLMHRVPVSIALEPGQSAQLEVPAGARGLILSGANVPRLREGVILGRIDPGGQVIRIGDIADWGALRREHYYRSRNPLPRRPGGRLRGYGQTSWIDASGRIAVEPGLVTVTADRALPSDARLQIDAIELAQ